MNEKGNLTDKEYIEYLSLLDLQSQKRRWMSQDEFDRLKTLSKKMFEFAGKPTEKK